MKKIEWCLKSMAIKFLKDNPKNPRQIDKRVQGKLAVFIEKFGLIDKPIINLDDTIIGGHQRIRILKKQKAKLVECWVPNRMLDEKEIDEMCVGLNLHQGTWDFDILANQWDAIDLLEYGFTEEQLLGVSKEDIAEETTGEDEEKQKKKHKCPSCGNEF